MNKYNDRVLGCLLGQYVGDALGARYEFTDMSTATEQIALDTTDGHLKMLGGGPFGLLAGQVTDDTEMAMALARSLARYEFDPTDIAASYIKWFYTSPCDMGMTIRSSIVGEQSIPKPDDPNVAKILQNNSRRFNKDSLSNGSLMRCSPLAIASLKWNEERTRRFVSMECSLTHVNPIAIDAATVYTLALRSALLTGNRAIVYDTARRVAQTRVVQQILDAAKASAEPVLIWPKGIEDISEEQVAVDRATNDSGYRGYLGIALQNAFYELLHGLDFESSMIQVLARGGDTDTVGCITAALLGAVYGSEAIPKTWRNAVFEAQAESQRVLDFPDVCANDLFDLVQKLSTK